MAKSLPYRTNFRENLEIFSVIWLDPSVDKYQIEEQLRSVIDYFVTFDNDESCFKYINKQSSDSRIFLITSGRHGRIIVPQLTDVAQITAIYIFCMDLRSNREWSKHYPKVNFWQIYDRTDVYYSSR